MQLLVQGSSICHKTWLLWPCDTCATWWFVRVSISKKVSTRCSALTFDLLISRSNVSNNLFFINGWPVGTTAVVIATGDRLGHAERTTGLHISPGGSISAAGNILVHQKCDFHCSDRWSCLVHFTPPYPPWLWPCNFKAISQCFDSPRSPIWLSWKCTGPLDMFCHPAVISSLSTYHMTHEYGNWNRVPLQQPSLYTIKHIHSYNLQTPEQETNVFYCMLFGACAWSSYVTMAIS